MKLKLEKDLVAFDLETTGVSVSKDRIVSIGLIKIFADGRPNLEKYRLINPTIHIPEETSEIHGIYDKDVENMPTFKELAKGLFELIGDSDLAGFNSNRFDIPILMEEFERAGMTLDMTKRSTVDVMRIFHKLERRDLSAAYKFYCNKKMEGAHNAINDVKATLEVLEAQLDRYKGVDYEDKDENIIPAPIQNNIKALSDFSITHGEVDFQGKIIMNKEGIEVFTFGKLQGKPVGESLAKDPKYMLWILEGDFATDTKKHVRRLVDEYHYYEKSQKELI